MWAIEPDSICNECRHCQFEGDGISEPVLCWCEEKMDNFGTTEGCYKYEEFVSNADGFKKREAKE